MLLPWQFRKSRVKTSVLGEIHSCRKQNKFQVKASRMLGIGFLLAMVSAGKLDSNKIADLTVGHSSEMLVLLRH